jgi:histidine triad (HIT) family protein
MNQHAPADYQCPFCSIASGSDNEGNWTKQSDVVFRDEGTTAFIGSRWWPNNPGHVIVIPNQHIENIYTMPQELHGKIYEVARQIALAFKLAFNCDGVSTRQHNEPDGYQEIWHYHVHVFPRFKDDYLYELTMRGRFTTPEERAPYARRIRNALSHL